MRAVNRFTPLSCAFWGAMLLGAAFAAQAEQPKQAPQKSKVRPPDPLEKEKAAPAKTQGKTKEMPPDDFGKSKAAPAKPKGKAKEMPPEPIEKSKALPPKI